MLRDTEREREIALMTIQLKFSYRDKGRAKTVKNKTRKCEG